MKNTKNILCIALAILAIPLCNAQEEQKITLQFLAFPKHLEPEPIELLIAEEKTIPIDIPGHELSPEYRVARPSLIVVGITTKNAEGDPVFQVLGQAPSLPSKSQIILLLRKGEENSDGFVVLPIDGAMGNFAGGNYLFINASELAVGGLIGDQKLALKPGQKKMLKPAANQPNGGLQVTLSYQKDEADTKGKKFLDTRWSVSKKFRTLVFFYQNPETKKLGVAPIVDIL